MKINIIIISLLLTACSTVPKIDTQHMNDVIIDSKTEDRYIIPKVNKCEELPELKSKKISDLYSYIVDISESYYKCQNNNETLQEWINNLKK